MCLIESLLGCLHEKVLVATSALLDEVVCISVSACLLLDTQHAPVTTHRAVRYRSVTLPAPVVHRRSHSTVSCLDTFTPSLVPCNA